MDQQTIDLIVEIINNYLPSLVAVIVALCSMITAIRKCKNVSDESVNSLKTMNKNLANDNAEIKKENRELKKLLQEAIASNRKVHLPESEKK